MTTNGSPNDRINIAAVYCGYPVCLQPECVRCSTRYIFCFQAEDGIRDGRVTGVPDVCSADLWVPLVTAAAIFLLMTTWQRGREILGKRMEEKTVALKMLLADLAAEPPLRVPGTAVFL